MSSPIEKTRSVDELTGVAELEISSPIQEKNVDDDELINEVTTVIPPANLEDQIQKSMEKAFLSGWLDVIQSGSQGLNAQGRCLGYIVWKMKQQGLIMVEFR